MQTDAAPRVIVIRVWLELISPSQSAWRGTLQLTGAAHPQQPFQGKTDLLERLNALLPDENSGVRNVLHDAP